MIYNNIEYKVKFYRNLKDNKSPILEYIDNLEIKEKAKVFKYIDFLRTNKGILDEPYSKHIKGKIRELRVDFSSKKHRIFYFTFIGKNIILLHAFLKKTAKTPPIEIKKAEQNYKNVLSNLKIYG
ncbi:type II toxin-antitoxin system RelE/ParE family toxin [Patescibacteria group bacterium]|nr:type II toxin-antitoxin system RelE/ParE family toxin [Patescibacteria group bacterium]